MNQPFPVSSLNSIKSGKYLWNKAHEMAMSCRRRTTENSRKDALIVWHRVGGSVTREE